MKKPVTVGATVGDAQEKQRHPTWFCPAKGCLWSLDNGPCKKHIKEQLARIIAEARRYKRLRDGLVICENCHNPASKHLSLELGWTCCAPCVWGEADSFDEDDLIHVGEEKP